MVNLICTDIDGTLLNKQRQVDDYTTKVFKQIDKNIQVILASSRMPKAMWHIQKSLDIEHMPLICYNGALILTSGKTFNTEKVIASVSIPADVITGIIELANLHHVHISLYQNNTWLASALDFYSEREINNTRVHPDGLINNLTAAELTDFLKHGAHKIMVMGKPEMVDLIEKTLSNKPVVALWRSKDIYLEISPQTNKIQGLKSLLKFIPDYANIGLENVMSFGDNYNDLQLIKEVKFGIAVENSVPELKSVAYEITKSNIEHGVAFYVDNFFSVPNP